MEILKIDAFLDGGTIVLSTNEDIYYIDNRIHSHTTGAVFLTYPKDDNSNIAPDQETLKLKIKDAIENYTLNINGLDWKPKVYKLLDQSNDN